MVKVAIDIPKGPLLDEADFPDPPFLFFFAALFSLSLLRIPREREREAGAVSFPAIRMFSSSSFDKLGTLIS